MEVSKEFQNVIGHTIKNFLEKEVLWVRMYKFLGWHIGIVPKVLM